MQLVKAIARLFWVTFPCDSLLLVEQDLGSVTWLGTMISQKYLTKMGLRRREPEKRRSTRQFYQAIWPQYPMLWDYSSTSAFSSSVYWGCEMAAVSRWLVLKSKTWKFMYACQCRRHGDTKLSQSRPEIFLCFSVICATLGPYNSKAFSALALGLPGELMRAEGHDADALEWQFLIRLSWVGMGGTHPECSLVRISVQACSGASQSGSVCRHPGLSPTPHPSWLCDPLGI